VRKIITDNFDKLIMLFIFMNIFCAALFYRLDWLGLLTRDAFLVLTALLGFRRTNPQQNNQTDSGDVIVTPDPEISDKTKGENL
jgi:hypothetical protein